MSEDKLPELTEEQMEQPAAAYANLKALALGCTVPAVQAAARVAVAQVHIAVNGQGLVYDLYSSELSGQTVR